MPNSVLFQIRQMASMGITRTKGVTGNAIKKLDAVLKISQRQILLYRQVRSSETRVLAIWIDHRDDSKSQHELSRSRHEVEIGNRARRSSTTIENYNIGCRYLSVLLMCCCALRIRCWSPLRAFQLLYSSKRSKLSGNGPPKRSHHNMHRVVSKTTRK